MSEDVLEKMGLIEKQQIKFYCPYHGKQETAYVIDGKHICIWCGSKLKVKRE